MSRPSVNRDFLDMVNALNRARVEYLVVGAHAMAVHGVPRAAGRTKDLVDLEILDHDREPE
jgi:hypothetical protein